MFNNCSDNRSRVIGRPANHHVTQPTVS